MNSEPHKGIVFAYINLKQKSLQICTTWITYKADENKLHITLFRALFACTLYMYTMYICDSTTSTSCITPYPMINVEAIVHSLAI